MAIAEGAIISSQTEISGTVDIGEGVIINGYAVIHSGARIFGNVLIDAGNESAGVIICQDALINAGIGYLYIPPRAYICEGARIFSNRDFLMVGPLGSEDRFITLCHTYSGHNIFVGCWNSGKGGSLDDLERTIQPGGGRSWADGPRARRFQAEYEAAIALCRLRVAEWAAEDTDQTPPLGTRNYFDAGLNATSGDAINI